ncbi:MAG: glucose-1-phosphate adenylyltransferase [SAR324 cluster bacterium]|nr:glucose-1-phosphate adenylyltransferase [SAR324 cluster bacterium]
MNVLSMILAGGEGTRLYPLTIDRAKPSVPIGGNYRIIDFVLNNFMNSGVLKMYVLTQFKSHSLMRHLRLGWRISGLTRTFIDPIPAQMQTGKKWYEGTADAIYQNINLIKDEDPELVCIFGGDHIYKMDIQQMIKFHQKKNAVMTVAAIPVPIRDAHHFGVIEVDDDWKMIGFQEKPKENPKTIPGDPDHVLASMGNYVFNTKELVEELMEDAQNVDSDHDFGKNIIPHLYPQGGVYVYNFLENDIPGISEKERGYWRDVGTIDAYWEANMDFIQVDPVFNLYNHKWPLNTYNPPYPPAKFVHFSEIRTGHAINSMVATGTIISGAMVEQCVISYNVRIHSFCHVSQSVIMDNVQIGRGAQIQRAIIDKDTIIAPGTRIGYDLEADRKRFHVSPNGIVVIPKGVRVE